MAISTAIDASAVARVVGIKTAFKDLSAGRARLLPQRVALVGQGATAATYVTTKRQVFTANEVGSTYGFGSPLHLAALQLLPLNGDGLGTVPLTVYPLEDGVAATTAAGDITPTVGTVTTDETYRVRVSNILSEAFVVNSTDAVADVIDKMVTAINAVPEMPVIASDGTTVLDLDAKWAGPTGNDIVLEVDSPDGANVTFAFTQPTGGATNPDVTTALNQIGGVWETMVVSCFDIADTTILNAYQTENEGRWLPTVNKPFIAFTGNTATTVSAATTVSDARKTDRTNCQLVEPGSNDLPFVVAARGVARIARQANNNPPVDYGSQDLSGLTPGADGDQWDYNQRDAAVKAGSSTIEVKDSVSYLSDTVTFYHPTGDLLPAYRFVVDIVKVMQVIYNVRLIFAVPEWDGAPLIPDEQPTTNPAAKKPKQARSEISALLDNLGLEAIISDPATAKQTIQVGISSTNPKRLDIQFTHAVSGNSNIISVDHNFGFFFGTNPVVG